jgi:hypothetical protein
MRKIVFFAAVAFFSVVTVFSQNDPELKNRLQLFMEANRAMDFEKIMDYTYPKLFTIAPRAQMIEVIKSTFDNEEMQIGMDSLNIDSLYPGFAIKQSSYAKVKYSMKMVMKFKLNEEDNKDGKMQMAEMMLPVMKKQFGNDKVRVDDAGVFHIKTTTYMVAIKDEYAKEWCFVNLNETDPLTKKILSKELLDKLATYK